MCANLAGTFRKAASRFAGGAAACVSGAALHNSFHPLHVVTYEQKHLELWLNILFVCWV